MSFGGHEGCAIMTIRTMRTTVTFRHPFSLQGADGPLPAGQDQVLTDWGLLHGFFFLAYRRGATLIFPPAVRPHSPGMLTIHPDDLPAAQEPARPASSGA